MIAVPCDRCEAVSPGHCPRCRYLLDNMARWHRVADLEHSKHCDRLGNCGPHVEAIYQELMAAEQDTKP